MKLTADQLREIADVVDKLGQVGVTVERFQVGPHKVMTQPLDGSLVVVGITTGDWSEPAKPTTCRCTGHRHRADCSVGNAVLR